MKCSEARQLFYEAPGGVQRVLLQMHLFRCPACRAEARQVRAVENALTDLPRFSPAPDLLRAVLAQANTLAPSRTPRKESRPMKRLAYATAFLVVIGLVAAGLLTRPHQPDGRALLISAAQAMEEAKTIHVRGRPNVGSKDPWGELGDMSYERWYSLEGSREHMYHSDGTLLRARASNVALGLSWSYGADQEQFLVYSIGSEDLALATERARRRLFEGKLWAFRDIEQGHQVTTRTGDRNGKRVTIVEVEHADVGTVEYYIDPPTGHLLGLRQFGPESVGKPVVADMETVEYGIPIPADVFAFNPPRGAKIMEGYFEVRRPGDIASEGNPYGPWDDPKVRTVVDGLKDANQLAQEAAAGLVPWEEAERAYLAVVQADRESDHTILFKAREYLGRIYTRQGRYADALAVLSERGRDWSPLTRAFCLDALGRREEAVALYQQWAGAGDIDEFSAWAQLGLQQPTWPADLDIRPESSEVQVKSAPGWHAAAFDSVAPTRVEFAIDENPYSRWAAWGRELAQERGEWFQLDFDTPVLMSRVVLDHQGAGSIYISDWPRGLSVTYTTDGVSWQEVAVTPAGPMQPATVRFEAPHYVRAIRFELTKPYHYWAAWAIHEIYVFGPAG